MSTQKLALLEYLKRHPKGLTTWVAFDALGISCVHKRIADLEADGYKIERLPVEGVNRYGNPCRVIRYRLLKAEPLWEPLLKTE